MFTQRADYPPANNVRTDKNSKADRREDGNKRAPEQHDFAPGSQEHGGMKNHHPPKSRFVYLGGPVPNHLPLMNAGNAQLVDAQERDDAQKSQKRDNA